VAWFVIERTIHGTDTILTDRKSGKEFLLYKKKLALEVPKPRTAAGCD